MSGAAHPLHPTQNIRVELEAGIAASALTSRRAVNGAIGTFTAIGALAVRSVNGVILNSLGDFVLT